MPSSHIFLTHAFIKNLHYAYYDTIFNTGGNFLITTPCHIFRVALKVSYNFDNFRSKSFSGDSERYPLLMTKTSEIPLFFWKK